MQNPNSWPACELTTRAGFALQLSQPVLSLAWLVVIFGKDIRRFIGGQTAEVAREIFKHESIQIQAQELATAVVNTLSNDPEVLAGTSVPATSSQSTPSRVITPEPAPYALLTSPKRLFAH